MGYLYRWSGLIMRYGRTTDSKWGVSGDHALPALDRSHRVHHHHDHLGIRYSPDPRCSCPAPSPRRWLIVFWWWFLPITSG